MAREMKDSGIEWIGEIPREWFCHSLKVIIVQNDGGIWGDDPINDDGELVLRSTEQTIDGKWNIVCPAKRDLSKIFNKKYYLCKKNDLLITKSSGSNLHIGKTTIVDDVIEKAQCYYSNFIQRIRLSQTVSAKYYWYILNSNIARSQFTYMQNTTSGIGNLNAQYIENLIIPKPPVQEQYYIERYLNVKCAELDNILRKTRASIEEYKKLKQAVITQAVTKGIRSDREMKDSGVEWIGEIPIEWELVPFRHVLKERQEKNSPIKSVERLSLSIDLGVTLYAEKTTNLDRFKDDFEQYKLAYEGDLVMNSMNMIVGATGVSDYFGCVSPVYYTFYDELEDHITAKYCEYIFRSKTMLRVLYSLGKGIYAIVRGDDRVNTCRLKVPKEDLKSIIISVPSVEEQREIVNYLKKKCSAIDELIAKKEQYLSEIENYKKSLIYEYVTGKKEVPQNC